MKKNKYKPVMKFFIQKFKTTDDVITAQFFFSLQTFNQLMHVHVEHVFN